MEMEVMDSDEQKKPAQTVIVQQTVNRTNGLGVAGFVMALIALFLGWIPVFGWIVWVLGFIFSACGLVKAPRGLAIAGFVISLVGLAFLLLVFGVLAAAISAGANF